MPEHSRITRRELLRHAFRSEQFESREDARVAVGRLFRGGHDNRANATSVIAEVLAMRRYPNAVPSSEYQDGQWPFGGTDFFVNHKRYQVKSVSLRNSKFLLNLGSHASRTGTYFRAPNCYVFVRIYRVDPANDSVIDVRYDLRVVASYRLLRILDEIRKKKGHLPRFGRYIKLLPSDLEFPNLRTRRHVR